MGKGGYVSPATLSNLWTTAAPGKIPLSLQHPDVACRVPHAAGVAHDGPYRNNVGESLVVRRVLDRLRDLRLTGRPDHPVLAPGRGFGGVAWRRYQFGLNYTLNLKLNTPITQWMKPPWGDGTERPNAEASAQDPPFHSLSSTKHEFAWLFVCGQQSVRLIRRVMQDGTRAIVIEGPHDFEEQHTFTDIVSCVSAQIRIEQRLVAQGYSLERMTSERRRAVDRRVVSRTDRRRARLRSPRS